LDWCTTNVPHAIKKGGRREVTLIIAIDVGTVTVARSIAEKSLLR
jgi:hypothetical protein